MSRIYAQTWWFRIAVTLALASIVLDAFVGVLAGMPVMAIGMVVLMVGARRYGII